MIAYINVTVTNSPDPIVTLIPVEAFANGGNIIVMGTDSVLISKQKGRKIEHFNN